MKSSLIASRPNDHFYLYQFSSSISRANLPVWKNPVACWCSFENESSVFASCNLIHLNKVGFVKVTPWHLHGRCASLREYYETIDSIECSNVWSRPWRHMGFHVQEYRCNRKWTGSTLTSKSPSKNLTWSSGFGRNHLKFVIEQNGWRGIKKRNG